MYFQQVLFQSWLDKKLDIHYLTNEYIISMIAISVYCVPFTSPLGTAPRSNNISSWIKSMFKNKVKEQILILNSPVSWSNFNYIMVLICTIFLATTYTLKSNKIEKLFAIWYEIWGSQQGTWTVAKREWLKNIQRDYYIFAKIFSI